MAIALNKERFKRSKLREQEFGDIFNKTANGLGTLLTLAIAIFFTPTMIATSLYSKEIIIILANILLSMGYLSNFFYRVYMNEISKSHVLISLLMLSLFIFGAHLFCTPVVVLNLLNVLIVANQMATALNAFFLIRHMIVPPVKKGIEVIAHLFGFNIRGRYYIKPALTLENDRVPIERLLNLKVNDRLPEKAEMDKQLEQLNRLLVKLSDYIDKYYESFLGGINNQDEINYLDKSIQDLTTEGDAASCYAFIKKKLAFKSTKRRQLQEARDELEITLNTLKKDEPEELRQSAEPHQWMRFFTGVSATELGDKNAHLATLQEGIGCIDRELAFQQKKIDSLLNCLPAHLQ